MIINKSNNDATCILKHCSRCDNQKLFTKAGKYCRDCMRERALVWRNNNLEKAKASDVKRRISGKKSEYRRLYMLQVNYGLSVEDYNRILHEQDNQCVMCINTTHNNISKSLCVDHCHSSGRIRGLLCGNCNTALGLFKDNEDYIKSAINYLKSSKKICLMDTKNILDVFLCPLKNTALKCRYGITIQNYYTLLSQQNNCCAICGSKSPQDNTKYFNVDHSHSTNEVRGLLCALCNKAIGLFKEDTNRMNKAIEYLIKHKAII